MKESSATQAKAWVADFFVPLQQTFQAIPNGNQNNNDWIDTCFYGNTKPQHTSLEICLHGLVPAKEQTDYGAGEMLLCGGKWPFGAD